MTGAAAIIPAVLIPTYDNAGTVRGVAEGCRRHVERVLVVDDGSTDGTSAALAGVDASIEVLRLPANRGKGAALRAGFERLAAAGATHALTVDADGQHFPDDLPAFLEAIRRRPEAIIIGQRDMAAAGAPRRSRFGLWCSRQALRALAGVDLPDSQSGFRAYPLGPVGRLELRGDRYDLEMEVLAKAAWAGIPLLPLPIRVSYEPEGGRVSHFRPVTDFLRIGLASLRLLAGRKGRPVAAPGPDPDRGPGGGPTQNL